MTDSQRPTDDQQATEPGTSPEAPLGRRGLIRAGALAAAATAGAVAVSATSAGKAGAANGDAVTVGGSFTGTGTTQLTVSPSSATVPALKLTNATGPSLALTKTTNDLSTDLPAGSLAFTPTGFLVGVLDENNQAFTTVVATYDDLATFPITGAVAPQRLLDTRSNRANVLATSAGAYDSSFRLKAGAYLDLAVGDANSDVMSLQAVFVNATAVSPLTTGYLVAYPSGATRPNASTVNFSAGVTLSNAAYVATGVVGTKFAIRIFAQATTHVIIDLSGVTETGLPGPAASMRSAQAARARNARTRPATRFRQTLGATRRRS